MSTKVGLRATAGSSAVRYRVIHDGSLAVIDRVGYEPDGYEVFETFAEAKHELLRYLRSRRDEFNYAAKQARKLKEADCG